MKTHVITGPFFIRRHKSSQLLNRLQNWIVIKSNTRATVSYKIFESGFYLEPADYLETGSSRVSGRFLSWTTSILYSRQPLHGPAQVGFILLLSNGTGLKNSFVSISFHRATSACSSIVRMKCTIMINNVVYVYNINKFYLASCVRTEHKQQLWLSFCKLGTN